MAEGRFKSRRHKVSVDSRLAGKPTKPTPSLVALARLLGRAAAEKGLLRKKVKEP